MGHLSAGWMWYLATLGSNYYVIEGDDHSFILMQCLSLSQMGQLK